MAFCGFCFFFWVALSLPPSVIAHQNEMGIVQTWASPLNDNSCPFVFNLYISCIFSVSRILNMEKKKEILCFIFTLNLTNAKNQNDNQPRQRRSIGIGANFQKLGGKI